jgi:hypothetical protein
MKQIFGALILSCGLAAAQANAACDYPVAPGKFPDGTLATKEEMLAAKKLVVKYDADMTAYLSCIQSEFDTKVALLDKNKTTPEQKAEMARLQDQKQTAAIDEVKSVTERFNEQLRAWKAKNVPEKKPS